MKRATELQDGDQEKKLHKRTRRSVAINRLNDTEWKTIKIDRDQTRRGRAATASALRGLIAGGVKEEREKARWRRNRDQTQQLSDGEHSICQGGRSIEMSAFEKIRLERDLGEEEVNWVWVSRGGLHHAAAIRARSRRPWLAAHVPAKLAGL